MTSAQYFVVNLSPFKEKGNQFLDKIFTVLSQLFENKALLNLTF